MFIEEKGKELLEKNLYRNFVLHVCNLFEFGVLGPAHVFSSISRMQEFIREDGYRFTSWPNQSLHWLTQPHPPIKEKSARKDFSGIFPKDKRTCSVVLEPLDHSINRAKEEAKRAFLQEKQQKQQVSEPGDAVANAGRIKNNLQIHDAKPPVKEVPNNNDVEEEEEDPIDKIFNATLISSSTSNSQDLKEKQGINQ